MGDQLGDERNQEFDQFHSQQTQDTWERNNFCEQQLNQAVNEKINQSSYANNDMSPDNKLGFMLITILVRSFWVIIPLYFVLGWWHKLNPNTNEKIKPEVACISDDRSMLCDLCYQVFCGFE